MMKYKGSKKIKGTIEMITGLHIGGSTDIIEIGGKDNPVIKHPISKEPYIPGSSIKGKMRSLLEWKHGKIETDASKGKKFGQVHQCGKKDCPVCVVFGTSADNNKNGPTRLIVRDAMLSRQYKKSQQERSPDWIPMDILEDKYENTINRITARANPRNFERVVAGAVFDFEMVYRIFDMDDDGKNDQDLFKDVLLGLKLVEEDALGGAASRGCGQVKIKIEINGELKSLNKISDDDFTRIEMSES